MKENPEGADTRSRSLAQQEAAWSTQFPPFADAEPQSVFDALRAFVRDGGQLQEIAWKDSIPVLQREVLEMLDADPRASTYSILMEHLVPLESRRSDAIFLVQNGIAILELKGKSTPHQADLDQVAAYARDLRAYHRECGSQPVHPVLVLMRRKGLRVHREGVWICSPDTLDELVAEIAGPGGGRLVSLPEFLHDDAFHPLPSLIQAARHLFFSGTIPRVWRANAITEPAVEYIANVAREAATSRTRHLVLVTGTPGAGKTLVGMRAVHSHYLDDLAIPRAGGLATLPAVFLSGNQPLVQVFQHILKGAGGGGKVFVRHIKGYLDRYVPHPGRVPPEHLIIFDEAQRAFTPEKVRKVHSNWPEDLIASEPALFAGVCERMPEWSVLVGLIGDGQHIYLGEEGGLVQWRTALENSREPGAWTVHAPARIEEVFAGSRIRTRWAPELHLDMQLRFHTASRWHDAVERLLSDQPRFSGIAAEPPASEYLDDDGAFRIWLTRDLGVAKDYLATRYKDTPESRFGLVASSRDKLLSEFGVPNLFLQYNRVRVGEWFADGDDATGSCRHLRTCLTEFQCQGLELDMVLLAWGTDFIRVNGQWSSKLARSFERGPVQPRNAHALRTNSYRVLLTRGRDGAVVFLPPVPLLDETYAYFKQFGFRDLEAASAAIAHLDG
jgi:hypothetical protein